jgi:hypothetical protein
MRTVHHLSAIAIITIIVGLVYGTVQQTYRTSANDPQTQIVQELRTRLEFGKSIDMYLKNDTVDLENSLGMFIETFDKNGQPLQSNALLDGKLPKLPSGVLQYVNAHKEDWITWQPRKTVRLAMGIAATNNDPVAYVAAGRSLVEVERRTSRLITFCGICWTLCLAIILINWLFNYYFDKKLLTSKI